MVKPHTVVARREKFKVNRPDIHSKSKSSKLKSSKNYHKRYVGQGKI